MKLASLHDELLYEENRLQRYYQNAKAAAATAADKFGNKFMQAGDAYAGAVEKKLEQFNKYANSDNQDTADTTKSDNKLQRYYKDAKAATQDVSKLSTIKSDIIKAITSPLNLPDNYADAKNKHAKYDVPVNQATVQNDLKIDLEQLFGNQAQQLFQGNFQRDRKSPLFNFKPNYELIKYLVPDLDPRSVYNKLKPYLVKAANDIKQQYYYNKRKEQESAKTSPKTQPQQNQTTQPQQNEYEQFFGTEDFNHRGELMLVEANYLGAILNPRANKIGAKLTVDDIGWLEAFYANVQLTRKMIEILSKAYVKLCSKKDAAGYQKSSDEQTAQAEILETDWTNPTGGKINDPTEYYEKFLTLCEKYPSYVDNIIASSPDRFIRTMGGLYRAYQSGDTTYQGYFEELKNALGGSFEKFTQNPTINPPPKPKVSNWR